MCCVVIVERRINCQKFCEHEWAIIINVNSILTHCRQNSKRYSGQVDVCGLRISEHCHNSQFPAFGFAANHFPWLRFRTDVFWWTNSGKWKTNLSSWWVPHHHTVWTPIIALPQYWCSSPTPSPSCYPFSPSSIYFLGYFGMIHHARHNLHSHSGTCVAWDECCILYVSRDTAAVFADFSTAAQHNCSTFHEFFFTMVRALYHTASIANYLTYNCLEITNS